MSATIKSLVGEYRSSHKLLGIGVGIPGIIDLATGTLHSALTCPAGPIIP